MIRQIYRNGFGGSLVLLLSGGQEEAFSDSIFCLLSQKLPNENFSLAVFETEDWDGSYSPWPFFTEKAKYFSGGGAETLARLATELTDIRKGFYRVYLAGYSLAGLFALWALRETALFDGCACCSGSLWFEGWEEYSLAHPVQRPACVYLSLGGKEEKAQDSLLCTIGGKTRNEEKRLSTESAVLHHVLVMNPGGHFASPDKRVAQGILWLLENKA